MNKLISVLVVCGLLFAVPAFATQNDSSQNRDGNFGVVTIQLPSMATNAIDTTIVSISDAEWVFADSVTAGGAAVIGYELQILSAFEGAVGTGGSGTVDSCQVAFDYSNDRVNWTEGVALTANLLTNAAPVSADILTVPAPYLRVRCKNTGAATGTARVVFSYPRK